MAAEIGRSDLNTALRGGTSLYTTADGSQREEENVVVVARITLLGTETSGDWHTILDAGQLPFDAAYFVPEESRIRQGSGTHSNTLKFSRVNSAGTVLDLTTTVAYTGATVVPLVAAAATLLPVLTKTDALRLTLVAVTTTNAGATFDLELKFRRKR